MEGKKKSGISRILNVYVGNLSLDSDNNATEDKEIFTLAKLQNALEEFYYDGDKEYHHSYSEISEWIIDQYTDDKKTSIDENLTYFLLGLQSICKKPNVKIKRNIEKLEDHITLEKKRICYLDNKFQYFLNELNKDKSNIIESVNKSKEESKNLKDDLHDSRIELENSKIELEKNKIELEKIKDELKNSKFDLIALTSLVFTAFTLVSMNVTVLTGIINADIEISLRQIISSIAIVNIMILSSVFLIYSTLRKISGDIKKDKQLYIISAVIIGIYAIVLCVGLFMF